VAFLVDDKQVSSVTPTSITKGLTAKGYPDLSGFRNGAHVLTVRVTDNSGYTASSTRAFTLDKTPPTLSSVTSGPSPFYPRKRDGYKDNHTVKFRSNEKATAKLVVKNSKGKTIRTITKSVSTGSSSIKWNGKTTSGKMIAGKYRWTLYLTDGAGNRSSGKSGSATIRFYQISKTGRSTVRIVER